MKNLCFVLLLVCYQVAAQKPYFVYFKDKANSPFSINDGTKFLSPRALERRSRFKIKLINRDLPVNTTYLTQIASLGPKVLGRSKWLNAALISATESQLIEIKKLPFVTNIDSDKAINGLRKQSEKSKLETEIDYDYGTSIIQNQQLGVDLLHKKNFNGKGVLVGILDSGFDRANTIDAFKAIFESKRVIDTYDFVTQTSNVYDDDGHGTSVMSCIGGLSAGRLIGTAPEASFALYRTEDVRSETRIEEVFWLFGAERADSLGVDVINSSLGYTTFDNASQDYKYTDLNGDKTIAAKAADFAVAAGIVVCVSAGNEGNSAWRFIGTPADADSVISVGAVDAAGNISSFSSFGPNAKGNVKPELVARGSSTTVASGSNNIGSSNGTSFSSPVLAGFIASFMQEFPLIPPMKLKEILIKSANLYPNFDVRLGYGLPKYTKAAELASEYMKSLVLANEKPIQNRFLASPNPVLGSDIKLILNDIELTENEIIKIYNNTELKINDTYKNTKARIQTLNPGLYIIEIKTGETLKLIKL